MNKYYKAVNIILIICMVGSVIFLYLEDLCSIIQIPITLFIIGLPVLINRHFNLFISRDIFIYYFFLFLAYFLGGVVDLYNKVWFYDIIVHSISGIVSYYFAIFLLKKNKLYNNKHYLFDIFFCLTIVLFNASIWEVIEFIIDIFFNTNMQHNIETGVFDTMKDILCALGGGLLSSITLHIRKLLRSR